DAGSFLARLRFGPIVAYWEGVALSHARRFEDAERAFQSLAHTFMFPEAQIQLGFVAVARGDLDRASTYLHNTALPWTPAGAYLAGLLAHRRGDDEEAIRLL